MKRILTVIVLSVAFLDSGAQQVIKNPRPSVCYASGKDEFTSVGPPKEYFLYKAQKAAGRTQTANIEVDYEGFSSEAQAAFQEAVDIWESILVTPVTIRIHAQWTPLGTGILGSAGPTLYVHDFDRAPLRNVWYPVALAEKITGKEINDPTEYDIEASFNSANAAWHFGLTGDEPPAGKYDMVSIVLHEIGHGLGITHAYDVANNAAYIPAYFDNKAVAYETGISISTGQNYVTSYGLPSASLKTEITTGSLYYASSFVKAANGGTPAVLYTPTTYVSGSSIAHLDEITYPAGDNNSLMTPAIGSAERILNPGPIIKAILKQIGWIHTAIDHVPLKDTENTTGPYHIVAKVTSDVIFTDVVLWYRKYGTGDVFHLFMSATGTPDEYEADIPGGYTDYGYSIQVDDAMGATIPTPLIVPGKVTAPVEFLFHTGPDNTPPVITHEKKEFITSSDDFIIDASITDNIGIDNVTLQWEFNSVPQADRSMTLMPGTGSIYETIISKNILHLGDTIRYRIRAEDSSIAGNVAFNPTATTYNEIIVTGFGEARDYYAQNFNDLSSADFFGNGFSVKSDASFDGHIMSPSPYPAAGASSGHLDFIYNLKIPIRVADKNTIVKFDEIALVEPGETGSVWPNEDFYDYVVVEGSTDGGVTWTALANGYDCRYNADWLTAWNRGTDGQNSTGVGTPSLYRSHSFNLLDKFHTDDVVAIRFRLFSDAFTAGWGWAIDNLKIQVDETPPVINHQHYDFVADTASMMLKMKITDNGGIKQIFVDYILYPGQSTSSQEIVVEPGVSTYSSKIDPTALGLIDGDELQYRIRAIDSVGNVGTFPSAGFISTAIISLDIPIDKLEANFTSQHDGIATNFYAVADGHMNSDHPYQSGLGIDGNSDFSFLTRKPIKVSSDNPNIYYQDIALVEYKDNLVKDYVVVEASKDGINWEQLVTPYAANANAQWKAAYDDGGQPNAKVPMVTHEIPITASGKFKAGDIVLVRFRLHSDYEVTGWGWIIDNLSIQGEITGLEPQPSDDIVAWPNPVVGNSLYLSLALPQASDVTVEILNAQGQLLRNDLFSAPSGDFQREYEVSDWQDGFYVVRIKSEFGTAVRKIIKLNSQK